MEGQGEEGRLGIAVFSESSEPQGLGFLAPTMDEVYELSQVLCSAGKWHHGNRVSLSVGRIGEKQLSSLSDIE